METNKPKFELEVCYEHMSTDSSRYKFINRFIVGYVLHGSITYRNDSACYTFERGNHYFVPQGNYAVIRQTGVEGIFEQVTIGVMRHKVDLIDIAPPRLSSEQQRFDRAVARGLISNSSIDSLAVDCFMTASTFKRRFATMFNSAPHGWFMSQRLVVAHRLLSCSKLCVRDVAQICGFVNNSHFIGCFKRRYGVTPLTLRRCQ